MPKWLKSIIWSAGSCVIWCPICVSLSNQGAWWVCVSTVGLVSITILSGYSTWAIINQLLYAKESKVQQYLSRYLHFTSNNDKDISRNCKFLDPTLLEQEISSIAQTFHWHVILPWYLHISPEEKYALQIRSTLEDLLTGVFRNIQLHSNVTGLLQELFTLYIQQFRQYHKALKKVSQKLNVKPNDCLEEKQEIQACFKPLHSAYKTPDGINLHCQRLSHLLLVNYLPSEVSRCSLLFISLRDLFAQKLLHFILDVLCDTQWLNKTLFLYLTSKFYPSKETVVPNDWAAAHPLFEDKTSDSLPLTEEYEDKELSYTHSLSAIREETSFDLSNIDNEFKLCGGKVSVDVLRRKSCSGNKSILKDPTVVSDNEKLAITSTAELPSINELKKLNVEISINEPKNIQTFESAADLIKYIRAPQPYNNPDCQFRSVQSALGDFISTTAVPLLPDNSNMFTTLHPLPAKMWISPVEEKYFLSEVAPKKRKNNPFKKNIVEGIKEEDFKLICQMLNENHSQTYLSKNKCSDNLEGTFRRSKSLTNLLGELSASELKELSISKHSVSTESLQRIGINLNESKANIFKRDKRLIKMNSFDTNDGTDDFSIRTNNPEVDNQPKNLKNIPTKESDVNDASKVSFPISSSPNLEIETDEGSEATTTDVGLSPKDENELNLENPELSPIYEESENLASTIAKLRCLLSERQSQHSLGSQSSFGSSESEPKSAQSDPGKYTLEKSKFTFFHKDSSGSLASIKSMSSADSYCPPAAEEEALEASEVPPDGRVFIGISIPTTEVHSETAGFQYTMYIIQYDAIYLCETLSTTPSTETSTTNSSQNSEPKMVLQTNFVKRRFREFLTLHSSLEEDPNLRLCMKGVKGPNKWLNLPFSKLDSATISSRKHFLEKYLQAIIQRPILNSSLPLKEFLAYGSDASVSFVKKPLELNVPRLDKLLARTVSGVFHSIKTALPTFDTTEGQPNGALSSALKNNQLVESCAKSFSPSNNKIIGPLTLTQKDFEIQLDMTAEEQNCEMEGAIIEVLTSTSDPSSPDGIESALEALDSHKSVSSSQSSVSFLPKSDSSNTWDYVPVNPIKKSANGNNLKNFDSPDFVTTNSFEPISHEDSFDESDTDPHLMLFKCGLDIFVEILSSSGHPVTRQASTDLLSRIFSNPVSLFIQEALGSLTCDENMHELFEKIRVCFVDALKDSNENSCKLNEKLWNYKKDLKAVIKDIIPSLVKAVLGKDVTEDFVSLLVESFQVPIVNQDFGLHLIDLLFVHVLLPIRVNN